MRPEGARQFGFGCASLFGLPSSRERRALLELAYELGIRHYDVAPVYGLGRAEPEFGRFRQAHPDVTVATKFGLALTPVGRVAGVAQSPIRRVLRRSHAIKKRVKQSGQGRSAGLVGSLLYRGNDYAVDSARASLERSRKLLAADRLDFFLLHEPAQQLPVDPRPLIDFLERQRELGRIGDWGPAGELPHGTSAELPLYARAGVVQHPHTLGADEVGDAFYTCTRRFLFGFLSGGLSRVRQLLDTDPAVRDAFRELAGRPADAASDAPALLVRDAIRRADGGLVLVSTTQPEHLRTLVAGVTDELANEDGILETLRQRFTAVEQPA